MNRTNRFLTGASILCISLMLTTSAYSYTVTPGHDYRIDMLASNFVGSVVGLSPSSLILIHEPTFVDSLQLVLDQASVPPGQMVPMHLDFWIASGSWGQSDTLRVRVDFDTSFQAQPPNWPLDIPLAVVATCSVSCYGIAEGEPYLAGADHVNGGCNSSPAVFRTIACGDTFCGTGFTFTQGSSHIRDTDWYQLLTTQPTNYKWEVEADFRVLTYVTDGTYGCAARAPIGYALADSCGMAVIETGCIPPGTYWFYVSPQNYTGIPQPKPYRAILTCNACESANPCELAENIVCPAVVTHNNSTGTDYWAGYGICGGFMETGPEKVYRLEIPYDGSILTATLSGMSADLDILLLNECHYSACINGGDVGFVDTLFAGTYYIVVEGYMGAVSDYTLTVSCISPVPPTPEIVIERLDTTEVRLTWEYSEPVDAFFVFGTDRSCFDPSPTEFLGSTLTNSYVDEGALNSRGVKYFYRVTAVRGVPSLGSGSSWNGIRRLMQFDDNSIGK